MKEGRVVVSRDSCLVADLLQTYHDGVAGGHSGMLKTYQRLAVDWYWFGMKDIEAYVAKCTIC